MKLDRNINKDGTGKYALLKLRPAAHARVNDPAVAEALQVLQCAGLIHWGDEGPGEQFFVMKYKDRFTHPALKAYARAVDLEAMKTSNAELSEYAAEIDIEAIHALRHGKRIPD